MSSSVANAAIGAQEAASFSGDDSGFGSEDDDDNNDSDAQSEDAEDHTQQHQDDEDDEDDVFDSLLSVIED